MLKALFHRQFLELKSRLIRTRNGQKPSKGRILLFALLYIYVFGIFAFLFGTMASELCAPLVEAGLGWLYFALMSLMAVFLGVFGSVFNTYTGLYRSKDNDLLLSMPIPPWEILFVRLCTIGLLGLLFEALAFVPAVVVYAVQAPFSAPGLVFQILLIFELALLVTVLTCLLGWVVALIAGRMKHKTFATVALSLLFMGAYFYFYSSAYKILGAILMNTEKISAVMRSWLFLFYHVGRAAEGNVLSMLLVTAVIAVLFGLTVWILGRSFSKIATDQRGAAKAVYREKRAKTWSVQSALLFKEFRRFLSSPVYMLNCGFGTIFMLVAPIAAGVKADALRDVLAVFGDGIVPLLPLILAAALCMLASMNDSTAPSISLEGRSLWIVRSFPVRAWDVLAAKLKLHLILTVPLLVVSSAVFAFVFRLSVPGAILATVAGVLFVVVEGCFGLAMNLLMPNLTWTNESVPVKQSAPVMLTLFGGWGLVVLLGVLYIPLSEVLAPTLYLALVCVILLALSVFLLLWLKKSGVRRFEGLD